MRKKIVITEGTGRFSQSLQNIKINHIVFFTIKKQLDILNFKKIQKYLRY